MILEFCSEYKDLWLSTRSFRLVVNNARGIRPDCKYDRLSEAEACKALGWSEQELLRKVWITLKGINLSAFPEEQGILRECERRLGFDRVTEQNLGPGNAKDTTTDAGATANELIAEALSSLPIIPRDKANAYVEVLGRSWGPLEVMSGSTLAAKSFLRAVLNGLAKRPGFVGFLVTIQKDEECAQASAFFQGSFTGVRVWRTGESGILCAAPKGVRRPWWKFW